MSAFKKAWHILKEDDDIPNEDFHQLNDPNPTIAFGAAMRNNPKIADMMRQRRYSIHECKNCGKKTNTDYYDVWSDSFCSQRCENGEKPTCREIRNEKCEYVLTQQPDYFREYSDAVGSPHFSITITCPHCDNSMSGEVAE